MEGKNGIILAVEEINAKGGLKGKKVQIIFEDSKNNPAVGVSALNRLIEMENTPVIISAMSSVSMALAPIVNKAGVVLFADVGHPLITQTGPWVFRNFPTTVTEASVMAKFILKEDIRKVGILFINDEWGNSLKEELLKSLSERVAITFVSPFEKDGRDFKSLLTKLMATNPQAVYLGGYGPALGILVKQLRNIGFQGKILASMGLANLDALSAAGEAAEGAICTAPAFDPSNSAVKDFVEKYRSKFGKDPDYNAAIEYDTVMLIASAMEKGGFSAEAIRDALLTKIGEYSGVSGQLRILSNRDITSPLTLKVIKHGKPIPYQGD